jgi:hypothetical protein
VWAAFVRTGLAAEALVAAGDAAPGRVQIAELSAEAETAVEKGLRFLASRQNSDGSWGERYPAATTAVALMAFMVKGHFPGKEPYGEEMERGVDYLVKRIQEGGGYVGRKGASHGSPNMYSQGLATLALSEVWGMSDQPEIRDALKQAVGVILKAQNRSGGWRYSPEPRDADVSVTVMQIVALASAQEAGILVPAEVIEKASEYVKGLQHPSGGFAYKSRGGRPEFARSAAGVVALMMSGERDSDAVRNGLGYLAKRSDSDLRRASHWYYAHYYAIQAMYQAGERPYQNWYPRIRDILLDQQEEDGGWHGMRGARSHGDPSYCTGMAILILGVPYRFLPIYQR